MKNNNKTINKFLDKIERLNTKISLQEKDISVYKRTIVKIQDENKITNIALDSHLDTFFLFDPLTSKALQWNKSFAKISGYTDIEITKLPAPASYYSPEDLERTENFIKKILKDNSGTIELELICKDGQKIPFEYQVVAVDDGKGETKNLLSIGRNITERKKSEYVLKESEEKYRGLFNNMSNGFALHKIVLNENKVPIDYTFIEINEAFENQTGLKKRNIIGKNVTKVLPGIEKDATDWIGIYGKVVLTQESIHFENFAEPLNKWYSVNAYSPQKGYFATIFEDITKRKQTEEKLKSRNKELETWAEVATNRELFMLDLKKEINELLEKSGKKPKYKIPI